MGIEHRLVTMLTSSQRFGGAQMGASAAGRKNPLRPSHRAGDDFDALFKCLYPSFPAACFESADAHSVIKKWGIKNQIYLLNVFINWQDITPSVVNRN